MSALGKIFKKFTINNHQLEVVEVINNIHDNSKNRKKLQVKYPNGRIWYEKTIKKNQDLNKVINKEIDFIKATHNFDSKEVKKLRGKDFIYVIPHPQLGIIESDYGSYILHKKNLNKKGYDLKIKNRNYNTGRITIELLPIKKTFPKKPKIHFQKEKENQSKNNDYSIEEKIKYFSRRMNNKHLNQRQRNYAKRRWTQLNKQLHQLN